MAQSRFIQSVLDAAREDAGASGAKSLSWFRRKIEEFGKPGPLDLIRDGRRTKSENFGTLNMFIYDPKHKNKLPFYDTFPLVLPIRWCRWWFLRSEFSLLTNPSQNKVVR